MPLSIPLPGLQNTWSFEREGKATSGSLPPQSLQSDANEARGVVGREADNNRCGKRSFLTEEEDLLWNNVWFPSYFRVYQEPRLLLLALVQRGVMEAERGGCVPSARTGRSGVTWWSRGRAGWWTAPICFAGRETSLSRKPADEEENSILQWLSELPARETFLLFSGPIDNTYFFSNNLYTAFVVLPLRLSISHVCVIDWLIDLSKIMRTVFSFTWGHLWLWKKSDSGILSIQDAHLGNNTEILNVLGKWKRRDCYWYSFNLTPTNLFPFTRTEKRIYQFPCTSYHVMCAC